MVDPIYFRLESTAKEMSWKERLHKQIQTRNEEEYLGIQYCCNRMEAQWKKLNRMENQRLSLRHKLKLMEYETGETTHKGDHHAALQSIRRKLEVFQAELSEYEQPPKINLSKIIYDQKLLISHQAEELALAKSELQAALERIADLSKALDDCNRQSVGSPDRQAPAEKKT